MATLTSIIRELKDMNCSKKEIEQVVEMFKVTESLRNKIEDKGVEM